MAEVHEDVTELFFHQIRDDLLDRFFHGSVILAFLYVPNGVNIMKWVPATSGGDYELSPTLAVLKERKDEFSVLSGLGQTFARQGC